jgi:general secretion pathway protein H
MQNLTQTISVTGNRPRSAGFPLYPPTRHHGFTLVEVLMVVLIIGVMISLTVMTLPEPSTQKKQETETKRIAHLVQLASENAVLKSRILGVLIAENDYQFVYFNPEEKIWKPLPDRIYRPRTLPESFKFRIALEGSGYAIPEIVDNTPQVILGANGEMTPFRLKVLNSDNQAFYEMITSLFGHIKITAIKNEK